MVVTVDGNRRVIEHGSVAIDGRDIVAVDTSAAIAARYSARRDGRRVGAVVMPGLINTHTHAPMVMFRGLADDLALMDWLQNYIFPAEAKTVSPEFVRAGTRLAALEMIESGTTTYVDMYYFEEEIARVTKAAGLRGVLGQTIIQFPAPDAKTPAEGLARTEKFIEEFKADDLITPAVAPHSMYLLDGATLKACRALADRLHVPVILHLSETNEEVATSREKYQATPAAYLESLGFWGPRTIAAHGVHLTPDEIQILARRHVGCVAQSREQHEARQRRRAGVGDARGRHSRRPRHGRRGQQQRPRHVRSDAPGGLPHKLTSDDPAGDSRAGRDRDGDHRRRTRRSGWNGRSARSSPANAPT